MTTASPRKEILSYGSDKLMGLRKRPWVADMWLQYGLPLRMLVDFALPALITPRYIQFVSQYGFCAIFTKVALYPDWSIMNDEVPYVMPTLLYTTILTNMLEVGLFVYYREKISPNWGPVSFHHGLLVAVYAVCVNQKQYGFVFQAGVALHHAAFWPLGAFRNWKNTFSDFQKFLLGLWIFPFYIYNHIVHLMVFNEVYGKPKAIYHHWNPLGLFICSIITFVSIFLFYHDYHVLKSVIKGMPFVGRSRVNKQL